MEDDAADLFYAIETGGNPAGVRLLVRAYPQLLTATGYKGFDGTPLHAAAMQDREEIARVLLEAGANPNAASANGLTPLHAAAYSGAVDIAALLLDAGADPSSTAKNGWTPFDMAHSRGHPELADFLAAAQAGVLGDLVRTRRLTHHELAAPVHELRSRRLATGRAATSQEWQATLARHFPAPR